MDNNDLTQLVNNLILTPPIKEKTLGAFVDWIDQLCVIVNLVPTVGGAMAAEIQAIAKATSEYRTYEFLRKLTCVILELGDLTAKDRKQFLQDVEKTANDASGNVIMGMIDRLDNINKGKILANLIRAKAEDQISIADFFRLVTMLERIPYVDLESLPLYVEDNYKLDGETELLYATGALRQSIIDYQGGDKFKLSILGVKLLRFGCNCNIEEDRYPTGTMSLNALVAEPIDDNEEYAHFF